MTAQERLVEAITNMDEQGALAVTDEMIANESDPLEVLDACREAMEQIGQQFEEGLCYVPELILAGEMLRAITDKIKPLMAEEAEEKKLGKVVIGTVEGDIHDIAKDIVVFMLDINGFEVTDLGVDVPPARFVQAAQETGARVVGLSGFLTLAYDPMKETVQALEGAGLDDVKVMIGGGQIDEQIKTYTGADAWGKDAMAAVNLSRKWLGAS